MVHSLASFLIIIDIFWAIDIAPVLRFWEDKWRTYSVADASQKGAPKMSCWCCCYYCCCYYCLHTSAFAALTLVTFFNEVILYTTQAQTCDNVRVHSASVHALLIFRLLSCEEDLRFEGIATKVRKSWVDFRVKLKSLLLRFWISPLDFVIPYRRVLEPIRNIEQGTGSIWYHIHTNIIPFCGPFPKAFSRCYLLHFFEHIPLLSPCSLFIRLPALFGFLVAVSMTFAFSSLTDYDIYSYLF